MLPKRLSCLLFVLCTGVLLVGPLAAQPVTIIQEDFELGSIEGALLNQAIITDLLDGRGNILSLTQGVNDQSGFAWFNAPFNLRDNKVTITLDVWIRTGASADPADGMSIIFQFGSDTSATGAGGGGLGTGNFPTDYVAVAFDIYDNGGTDPESVCDGVGNRTCHVEVNQNSFPGNDPSAQTNVDFGVQAPDFTAVGDTLVPIEATIVFDNGQIEVALAIEGDPVFDTPQTVLETALEDFPAVADAIIGFGASTGGANAHHEIDNLLVETDEPTQRLTEVVRLGDGDQGAINCGSATEVTGNVRGVTYTFVKDVAQGGFLRTDDTVDPVVDYFAAYGFTAGDNAGGPTGIAVANVGDENLQDMYQTERWQNGPVAYAFDVNSGRFEVNLHFAETCDTCGVSATGDATRIMSAGIEGQEVLSQWSAAQAAGNDTGSGPVAHTAVVRSFELDVNDGLLEVYVGDLGLNGTPAENAMIKGISYRRLGDATGGALTGDVEDFAPIELPDIERTVIVDTGFDLDTVGFCPDADDWRCADNAIFSPQVVDTSDYHVLGIDPRLRLTDVSGSVATTVLLGEQVDLSTYGFEAEFTVFLTQDPATNATPADGMTFFFLPYEDDLPDPPPVGDAGGALAINNIGSPAVAIEIDTYQGAGDPNGIPQTGSGHVGLIFNGDVTQHLHTSAALSPLNEGPGWPLTLEGGQFPFSTFDLESAGSAGLRVEVDFNHGRLRAWISSVNTDLGDGFVYPRTKVLDTLPEWAVGPDLGRGYFGFSAATGGAMTYHEVDDVTITLTLNEVIEVTRRVLGAAFTDSSTPVPVELDYTVRAGTGTHTIEIVEQLPAGWSAQSISDGGTFDDASDTITWSLSDIDVSGTVDYELIPDDATQGPVTLTGTYSVDGLPALPIGSDTVNWAPAPFSRGAVTQVIEDDFEDYNDGECPEGWSCNGGSGGLLPFTPGVTLALDHEGRLRLAEDTVGDIGSTVIYETPIDLSEQLLTAEFDAYFSNNGAIPADGLTFFLLDASDGTVSAQSVGATGGGLGYAGLNGLAVELDLYQGAGDPSGYQTPAVAFGHIGVIRDGDVVNHVQTHLDLDPTLVPPDWPDFVDPTGVGRPLHVEVDYNNGNIQVWLSADDADGLGTPFPRTLVIDTVVVWPVDPGIPDDSPVLGEVYMGFSAGTGGSMAHHEVDNLIVTLYGIGEGGVQFARGDADANGGAPNITDGIYTLNFLFLGGPPPPCRDAADSDDNGAVNITDGIYTLNFLFLGGPPPPAPQAPTCGPDGTDDPLECASFPPCE